MKRIKPLFCLSCAAFYVVCLTPFARAATLNVPAQYAAIGDAVTAANTGDTVLVADGTYTGAGNRNVDFGGYNTTRTPRRKRAKLIMQKGAKRCLKR